MGLVTYTPVTGFDQVSYVGPSVTGSDLQILSLFRPDTKRWSRPAAGWPTVVWIEMSGNRHTHIATQIGPQTDYLNGTLTDFDGTYGNKLWLLRMLDAGWQVVFAAVTVAFGTDVGNGTTTGQVGVANIDYVLGVSTFAYGTAPDGSGVSFPADWDAAGNGYKDASGLTIAQGAVHPFNDVRRHNAYMDSEMIAQFIDANHVAMQIDMDNVIGAGDSAGADVSCWCAYGPNRAPARWLNPSGRELLSTQIYRGAFYKPWQPYFNMLGNSYASPAGTCRHPLTGSHTLSMHFDRPGTDITLIDRDMVVAYDPLTYLDAKMAAQNFCFTYFTDDDTSSPAAGGNAWTSPVQGVVPTNPHDGYGGGLWKVALGARCVLYVVDTIAPDTLVKPSVADFFYYAVSGGGSDGGYWKLHRIIIDAIEADLGIEHRWAFAPHKALETRP